MKRRQLISSEEAVQAECQHTEPCSDCPMTRKSLPGWLGGDTPEEYVQLAHSDAVVGCHVISNQQCAGMAIYRRNVVKRCDPPNLVLPKNVVKVFATPKEFLDHHKGCVGVCAESASRGSPPCTLGNCKRKDGA